MSLTKYLDKFGIAKAVVTTLNEEANMKNVMAALSTSQDLETIDPFTENIKNVLMDHSTVKKLIEEYPDRFVGSYWFNPLHPDEERAFRELSTAIDEWGFRMVKIHSTIHRGRVPEDIERLAEYCSERDVPLFVHLCPPFFTFRGVRPLDLVKTCQQYPKLKVILGHFAYMMETCIESCVASTLCPNIYLDTSLAIPYGVFTGYKAVGFNRVLYGSDAPTAGPPSIEMEKVDLLQIPDEEKQAIFYENIAKLVGVED
jgi:predicted TIM-barrel fold metal-dependent hydrolase